MSVGVYLKESIIRAGFEYATREQVPLCGFLGDDCVTLQHTPEIQVYQLRLVTLSRTENRPDYCPAIRDFAQCVSTSYAVV